MESKLKELFLDFSDSKTLTRIRREVKEGSYETIVTRKGQQANETRRGRSKYVIDGIHEVLDGPGPRHLDCKNAEGPCLIALLKKYMTKKIYKTVIDSLVVLIPALFPKINSQNKWFSVFSQTIQHKFKKYDDVVGYAKRLVLPKEARKLQQINYSAYVAKANANQIELSDTKVLDVIGRLWQGSSNGDDFISQICLIGLCVGSRIVEICKVSDFKETGSPHWIQVIGVAKSRTEGERSFKKPVIMLLAANIIQIVANIRRQLERRYHIDLGEGEGGEDAKEITREKLTNLVDAKANNRIRELFGEQYRFHDTRAIYGQLAWIEYAPPGVSQTSFYSSVLGHKEGSLTTALSYQTFAIKRALKEQDPDIATKFAYLEAEFKAVKSSIPTAQVQPLTDTIQIPTAQGIVLTIKKAPRIREGKEKRMERLHALVQSELVANGVTPTHRNAAALGFSKNLVNLYFKSRKVA